jgi:ADP-ribose pyrophosphatase YjhB (NUDIX family)
LLIRRDKPPRRGQWSLPGGAQQLGETVAQAACREVREEAGIAVELGAIIATVDLIERDPDQRVRYHYTLIDFVAEAASPALRPGSDAADARWFGIAEVEALGLWSETVRIINLALEQRPCR